MRLTALLRGVLRSEGEFTTLGRELDVIEAYLDIERARFEQRLRVTIDVPAALRSLRVPPLVLQPIVENAVKHGIAPLRQGGDGHVTRAARSLGTAARMLVAHRRATPAPASTAARCDRGRAAGVGLRNIERRLACQYGDGGVAVDHDSARRRARPSRSACRSTMPSAHGRVSRRRRSAVVSARLRVVVADDERPARSFLVALLRSFDDVVVVGEAASGKEAVAPIESERPDLALLDLQMPELDGIGVVRMLKKAEMPLIAFVTAYDEYAVRAFEVNAVDYLLKPVEKARLRETLNRARSASSTPRSSPSRAHARRRGDRRLRGAASRRLSSGFRCARGKKSVIVPVQQIASIVADGELLHITTREERAAHDHLSAEGSRSAARPGAFIRLGRGTLANVELIHEGQRDAGRHAPRRAANGQKLQVSRLQSRIIRERFLKL